MSPLKNCPYPLLCWYLAGLDDLGRDVPVHLTTAGHELLDLLHRTGHTGQQLHTVTRYQDVVLHAGLQQNQNNHRVVTGGKGGKLGKAFTFI